jgi:hypothetical protein
LYLLYTGVFEDAMNVMVAKTLMTTVRELTHCKFGAK